jgi:hypothetical protein
MKVTFDQRLAAILEDGQRIVDLVEAELDRRVVYLTRGCVLSDMIVGVRKTMNEFECAGVPSDFDSDWRKLESRLIDARSRLAAYLSGSSDNIQPCHSRRRDTR